MYIGMRTTILAHLMLICTCACASAIAIRYLVADWQARTLHAYVLLQACVHLDVVGKVRRPRCRKHVYATGWMLHRLDKCIKLESIAQDFGQEPPSDCALLNLGI